MEEMTWSLPDDLLEKSVEVMRPHGRMGNEGLALWLGKTEGSCARVTHIVSLHGDGFRTSPLQLRLSWNAMSALTELADKLDAYLVGQIHSHPGHFIDLSEVDQVYGIRCQNYLSMVCPHYAQRAIVGIHECGVHIFDRGNYRRFAAGEVSRRIETSKETVASIELEVPA